MKKSTDNMLQTFNFDNHQVRTLLDENNNPLFVAKDVATALGYKKPENAIARHCKNQITTPKQGGGKLTLIPESDLYRLIFGSKLKAADKFVDWVTAEVLPQIRKTGSYTHSTLTKNLPTQAKLAPVDTVTNNPLIRLSVNENQITFTNTVQIARVFGMDHQLLIKHVETILKDGNEAVCNNFKDGEYLNAKNKVEVYYDITQDGLFMIPVDYTSKQTPATIQAYMTEFNRLRTQQQEIKALGQTNKPHREHAQITPHNDTCYISHKEIARAFNLDEQQVKNDIKVVEKMLSEMKLQSPKAFPISSVRARESVAYQAYFLLFVPNTPETLSARLQTIANINEHHNDLMEKSKETVETQTQRWLEQNNELRDRLEQHQILVSVMKTELSMLRGMLDDKDKQQVFKHKTINDLGDIIKELVDSNPDNAQFKRLHGQFDLLSSIEAVITGAMQKDIDRTNERVKSFNDKASTKNPHIGLKDIMLHKIH